MHKMIRKLKTVLRLLFQTKLVFAVFILLFTSDLIFVEKYGGSYYEDNPILYALLIITSVYVITGLSIFFKRRIQQLNLHRVIPALLAFITFYFLFNILHVDKASSIAPIFNFLIIIDISLFFASIIAFVEILIFSESKTRKKYLLIFAIAMLLMLLDTLSKIPFA